MRSKDQNIPREIPKEPSYRVTLTQKQQNVLNKAVNERWKELQEKTGMAAIQKQFENEAQKPRKQETFFFDRFHSFLRYFNANTPTNCFKSGVITPLINFIGQIFNIANDHDCELASEFFTLKKDNPCARSVLELLALGDMWLAFGKIVISSLGASIRFAATFTDFVLDAIFSPIRTAKNIWAAITNPKYFFNHVHRHYQLSTTDAEPILKTRSAPIYISMLSINICMFRDWFWVLLRDKDEQGKPIQFNKLNPPKDRIQDLIDDLVERAKNRDVICLQEMFDNLSYLGFEKDTQQVLIDALKPYFPHRVYDIGHRSWPFVGSGLIVFSKHPILDVDYFRFPNLMGVDVLSNKGCVGVKIQKADRFFTVYNTHLQAEIGNLTQWMEYLSRKSPPVGKGDYRDEELGFIHEHMQQWANTPPPSASNLKYLDTYLVGDLNEGLNNYNKVFGISHGKKTMGALGPRESGKIKYYKKNQLMHDLSVLSPDNFVDTRNHEPMTKGRCDKIDPDKSAALDSIKKKIIADIVLEIKNNEELRDIDENQLTKEVSERLLVYTGSFIKTKCLLDDLHSVPDTTRAKEEDDFEGERFLDFAASADINQPEELKKRCLKKLSYTSRIFNPIGKSGTHYTDHGGLTLDSSYATISSESPTP